MVRLRVTTAAPTPPAYGISIPTWYDWEPPEKERYGVFIVISIPTWYDWEFRYYSGHIAKFSISIPTWYDWERAGGSVDLAPHRISIPTWYDWEKTWTKPWLRTTYHFNSNMVRLREEISHEANYVLQEFQFQHGTIERTLNLALKLWTSAISIPTWYDWEHKLLR